MKEGGGHPGRLQGSQEEKDREGTFRFSNKRGRAARAQPEQMEARTQRGLWKVSQAWTEEKTE